MDRKNLRGPAALLLASVFWGSTFVAQRAGMDHIGPYYFNAVRMFVSALVLLPFAVWSWKKGHRSPAGNAAVNSVPGAPTADGIAERSYSASGSVTVGNAPSDTAVAEAGVNNVPDPKTQIIAGICVGLLLALSSLLQQAGLVYTPAGKAGFITSLYVVLVPIAGWLLFRRDPGRWIWVSVVLSVTGLFLLSVPVGENMSLNPGDLLVLGCALGYTGHILTVDRFSDRTDPIVLSCSQFAVTGVVSLIMALCNETFALSDIREALFPILYAGLFSGALGFTLQIIGQRGTDPTLASLLMCLESVFAVLSGVLILREPISPREAIGCVLMFSAVILATLSPLLGTRGRFSRSKCVNGDGSD